MAVAKKASAKKTPARGPAKKVAAVKKVAAAKKVATRKKPAPAAKAATAAQAAPAAKPQKADKPKKAKLVRDSYTMPKAEYTVLEQLKLRAATLGQPAKKSELLRAGLKALAGMADAAFKTSVAAIPGLKSGPPDKDS
jgi:hypothetical protein